MAKLPAFQFYPADWRKDPGIQMLTFHDRGVWFELLCLMHESPKRGLLLAPSGKKISTEELSRLLHLDKQVLNRTLNTIVNVGVGSYDPETGALMSRRMVRDEEIREKRKNIGKLGGNPDLVNQMDNQEVNQGANQKGGSSSSSSASAKEESKYKARPSLEETLHYATVIGCPKDVAEQFWNHFESSGWVDKNGNPIVKWRPKLSSWLAHFRSKGAELRHHSGDRARTKPESNQLQEKIHVKSL